MFKSMKTGLDHPDENQEQYLYLDLITQGHSVSRSLSLMKR